MEQRIHERLKDLSDRLGDGAWLDGEFTAGDLLMVSVLRIVDGEGLVERYDNVAAYMARGVARPAFRRAFDAQLAGFTGSPSPEVQAWLDRLEQGETA